MGNMKPNKDFVKGVNKNLLKAALKVVNESSKEMANDAPWEDDTKEARESFEGFAQESSKGIMCGVANHAEHIVYLERSGFGKLAVMGPYFNKESKNFLRRIADEIKH